MIKLYLDVDDRLCAVYDSENIITEELVGAGRMVELEEDYYNTIKDYKGNTIVDGSLVEGEPFTFTLKQPEPDFTIAETEKLITEYPNLGWVLLERLGV